MLPENKASNMLQYASKADPELIQPIPTEYQEQGVKPLDSLPAQFWNWLWNQMTTQHNLTVTTVTSILTELQNVLTLAGISPNEADQGQLAEAIKKLTKDIIGDFSDLKFASDNIDTVVAALNSLYDSITDEINPKINAIEEKIPSSASSTNKLTDEAFVLRHVATNTANFRGEWPTWSDVPTDGDQYPIDYAGNHNPTENDYMVVRDMRDYDGSTSNVAIDKESLTASLNSILEKTSSDSGLFNALSQINLLAMNLAVEMAHNAPIDDTLFTQTENIRKGSEAISNQFRTLGTYCQNALSLVDGSFPPLSSAVKEINSQSVNINSDVQQLSSDIQDARERAVSLYGESNGYVTVLDEMSNPENMPTVVSTSGEIVTESFSMVQVMNAVTYKGAWQFKYTGDWTKQGKAGWEPEFSLGSLVDYDELDNRYALKTSVETIESKIPAEASPDNLLADRQWVDENSGNDWSGTFTELESALKITDKSNPKYIRDRTGIDVFDYEQSTLQPVSNRVQEGDLNPVTSNAVANRLTLDWDNKINLTNEMLSSSYNCPMSGMVTIAGVFNWISNPCKMYVNVNDVYVSSIVAGSQSSDFTGASLQLTVSKGDIINLVNYGTRINELYAYFIPYKYQPKGEN